MASLVSLHHITSYHYDRPVSLGPHLIRLRPVALGTRVSDYRLTVLPREHLLHWQQDPFGNWLARIIFPEKSDEFRVDVEFTADITDTDPFAFLIESNAEAWPFSYTTEFRSDLAPYLKNEQMGPKLTAHAALVHTDEATLPFLNDLNRRLSNEIGYLVRDTPGVQAPDETLELGTGSCRDKAWLLVETLRELGLAARFVSGYLIPYPSDPTSPAGSAPGDDAVELHAWVDVYLPGAGWIGFDPTLGLLCGSRHLAVAAAPHYFSAAPITGSVEPSGVEAHFEISIDPAG